MADDVSKEMTNIKKDVEQLRTDFADVAKSIKELAREKTSKARAVVGDELDRAVTEVREHGGRAAARVEREIDERPLTVLAMAVGLGFILGKLIDRR